MAENDLQALRRVETTELLEQGIASWKKNDPIENWPEEFSIKPLLLPKVDADTGEPVINGTLLIAAAVELEEGDPTTYSAWLEKGADGKFDQLVLLSPEQVRAIYKDEAEPIINQVRDNINPTGEPPVAEDKLSWYNVNTKERGPASEGLSDEKIQELKDNGFKEIYYTPNVEHDPAVLALHEHALVFNGAAQMAGSVKPRGLVPEKIIEASKEVSIRPQPKGAVEAAPEVVPKDKPEHKPVAEEAAPEAAEAPLKEEPKDMAEKELPDFEEMNVLVPENLPESPRAAAELLYTQATRVCDMLGHKKITPEQAKEGGLIEQFKGTEFGDKYAAALEAQIAGASRGDVRNELSKIGGDYLRASIAKNAPDKKIEDGGKVEKAQEPEGGKPEEEKPEKSAHELRVERMDATVEALKNPGFGDGAKPVADAKGGVVTVDRGEGDVQALWHDAQGQAVLLDEEELMKMIEASTEEAEALAEKGDLAEALAGMHRISSLASSLEEVHSVKAGDQNADFDAGGEAYKDMKEAELAKKLAEELKPAEPEAPKGDGAAPAQQPQPVAPGS